MIGDVSWFARIFGAVADGDISANTGVARAAIRAGLAVVILKPDSKLPACVLTEMERKREDKKAQQVAKDADSPNWERVRHDCGLNHALTKESSLTRKVVKELLESGANLGISLKHSTARICVVDVDSASQLAAFHVKHPLTVTSPGTQDEDGTWLHKDGGHFWFDFPDDFDIPENPGKYTHPDGWCAYFNSGYVLIPPSVRPEGAYLCTGDVYEAPTFLLECISGAGEGYKPANLELDDLDPINRWSADNSWDDLLEPEGFTKAGFDNCGCPTWTRPGQPAHTKSATAHEVGCTKYDTSTGHGPLHIWSDVLGVRTISKLTWYAETQGVSVSTAITDLGLHREAEPAPEFEVSDYPKVSTAYRERVRRMI